MVDAAHRYAAGYRACSRAIPSVSCSIRPRFVFFSGILYLAKQAHIGTQTSQVHRLCGVRQGQRDLRDFPGIVLDNTDDGASRVALDL